MVGRPSTAEDPAVVPVPTADTWRRELGGIKGRVWSGLNGARRFSVAGSRTKCLYIQKKSNWDISGVKVQYFLIYKSRAPLFSFILANTHLD